MTRRWLYICMAAVMITVSAAGCAGSTTAQNPQEGGTASTAETAAENEVEVPGVILPSDAKVGIAMYTGEGTDAIFMRQLADRTQKNLTDAGIPEGQITRTEAVSGGNDLLEAVKGLTAEPKDVILVGGADGETMPQITDLVVESGAALLYFGGAPEQGETDRWTENGWRVAYVGGNTAGIGDLRAQILDQLDFDDVDANEDHHVSAVLLNTNEDSLGNRINLESLDALGTYHFTVERLDAPKEEENTEGTDGDYENDGAGENYEDEDTDANDANDYGDDEEEEEEAPDIIEDRRNEAYNQVTDWINEYGKDLEVIISADDALSMGACEAVEDYKQRVGHGVVILGFSAYEDSLKEVAGGNIAGTIFNDSLKQSQDMSDAALAYLRGEEVPKEILSDYVKVTADNAQEIIDVISSVPGEGDNSDSEDDGSDSEDSDSEEE